MSALHVILQAVMIVHRVCKSKLDTFTSMLNLPSEERGTQRKRLPSSLQAVRTNLGVNYVAKVNEP